MIFNASGGGKSSKAPTFTFSGNYQFFMEDEKNWRIEFYSSGVLNFSDLGGAASGIDVFLVGGGGAGTRNTNNAAGGAGGYTKTVTTFIAKAVNYSIEIGAGGTVATSTGGTGGTTSAFGESAAGGTGGYTGGSSSTSRGGTGGSGGGSWTVAPGEDGSNGGGTGQGTTTRAFGDPAGTLYAGGGGANTFPGGGGGGGNGQGATGGVTAGGENTGGGGGGGYSTAGAGGSGIVVIRNTRS